MTADEFLLRHAPRPLEPVNEGLLRTRATLATALADFTAVPDDALERPWPWRGGEADVRYGFYRCYELLEETRARVRPLLAAALTKEPPARALVASATVARWELHGLLAGLDDADLDADPGNHEWTLRQTLGHIVGGQRAYGWFTAWRLDQPKLPPEQFPPSVPDELGDVLPDETLEGAGRLDEIRTRLDAILDDSAGALGGLDHDEMAAGARWSGVEVTVGFRLGRWSSHIREHTVQLHKTLAMIGRPRREVEYLVGLIGAAYGRLEEDLYMWPADAAGVGEGIGLAASAVDQVARDAMSVSAAAKRA
jgi:hypothetical protein